MGKTLSVIGVTLLAVGVAWSYGSGGIINTLVRPGLASGERIEMVQAYFAAWGILAPVAYVVMVIIEVVVAPLPGLMLYAPGGIIFGGFWGGLLSLAGNVCGAGIACQLMRVFGRKRLDHLLSGGKFEKYEQRLSNAGVWIILAMRINPLTSSDLVSYAAGVTSMPTWKVMIGTLLGMAPLCWAQAYLAGALLEVFPGLIYPLVGLCVIYAVIAIVIFRKTFSPEKSPDTTIQGH
ncbi:MAG: TVP38/TMEM64 family protein [Phycisphaeraceae bacterium]|nr:TVP38/TMEM64 family protein [Phycisphaeraceae bacterium]